MCAERYWARTVKSLNPAFADVDVPLASTFMLSTKKGKEAYVEPVVKAGNYRFMVKVGKPNDSAGTKRGTKLARANFSCLMSGAPISPYYIRADAKAGRLGQKLMAIVAEGTRKRVYLPPSSLHERSAITSKPNWRPEIDFFQQALGFRVGNYGMSQWCDVFTDRQLSALEAFSALVTDASSEAKKAAIRAGYIDDDQHLGQGGTGAQAYADAVALYLAFGVNRLANRLATLCIGNRIGEKIEQVFKMQVLTMMWDFAETNVFSDSSGGWSGSIGWVPAAIENFPSAEHDGRAVQKNALNQCISDNKVVSTDPPYYDNVGYADLSDFFYVWLRRSQRVAFPSLFGTLTTPKQEELVATPARHNGSSGAEAFFLEGMSGAMHTLAERAHPSFPITIYYAFKQSQTQRDTGTTSTGWETFLDEVIRAGFAISGTWPVKTERGEGVRDLNRNSLASSVVLVCQSRLNTSPAATRRDFVNSLKSELPKALAKLQVGNIAPVDLAQAAIGPGMAVFTRYGKVLDAEGKPLSVRAALALINQVLDEVLAEQEGDFDPDTRFAPAWFEQHGFDEGVFGVADTLSKAKNTSVQGLVDAGVLASKGGKVRLLTPEELPSAWDPATEPRLTAWEMVHHLIRVLESGGEAAAGELAARLGTKAELARELCYRLYTLCERKKRAAEALSYNALVQSWPEIVRLAQESTDAPPPEQGVLL
jgi:putative DNA methylase